MSVWLVIAVCLVFAYLSGGIPFGAVVARAHKVDITKAGSGNTGATNVFRTLGWKAGLVVAVLDVAKGAAPALLALVLAAAWPQWQRDLLVVATACAAMIGHMYSPYFGLRGGKGIATVGGGIAVLMPLAFAILLVAFVAAIAIARIVSVASLTLAVAFPAIIWALYPDRPVLLVFALVASPLVIWRHRANIRRLARGEEPRIEWKPTADSGE